MNITLREASRKLRMRAQIVKCLRRIFLPESSMFFGSAKFFCRDEKRHLYSALHTTQIHGDVCVVRAVTLENKPLFANWSSMNTKLLLRRCSFVVVTFCLFTGLAAGQVCPGGSGCPDPTFGDGGVSTVPSFGAGMGEGTVQSDGKAVVLMQYSGAVEVIRFNPNGGPDLTFGGGDGVASLSWAAPGGTYGTPNAITTQTDDGVEKIILAGWIYVQVGRKLEVALRVDRLLPDGSLDPAFGTSGSFVTKAGRASAVIVQPWDQKIVTAGSDPLHVARLFPDGGLDTSFGSGGVVSTTNVVSGAAVGLQADGKILVAGTAPGKGQKVYMAVARFGANGTIDMGFGTSGKTNIDFGTNARARDVKLAGDKIVLAGSAGEFSSNDMAVARLTPSGQLDSTFSGDGKITYDFEGLTDYGWGVTVRLDGRLLVVGEADTLPSHRRNLKIVGYTTTGLLDAPFGTNGVVTTDVSGESEYGRKVFVLNDPACFCEKILVVGMMNTPTGSRALAARYLP